MLTDSSHLASLPFFFAGHERSPADEIVFVKPPPQVVGHLRASGWFAVRLARRTSAAVSERADTVAGIARRARRVAMILMRFVFGVTSAVLAPANELPFETRIGPPVIDPQKANATWPLQKTAVTPGGDAWVHAALNI